MKIYNKILEAIQRGINIAIDDFEDYDNPISSQKSGVINDTNATKQIIDLHKEFIDLGLPSGTLWRRCNIGATCEKTPESWFGNYFSWGDPETIKNSWSERTYKFEGKLTKYNKKDGLIDLLPEDDQATQLVHIHDFYIHVPTKEQCEELIRYCKLTEEKDYGGCIGLSGYLVTSKINENRIFIPSAGYFFMDSNNQVGEHCAIQSSTRYSDPYRYYGLMFEKGKALMNSSYYRNAGLPIRPVCNP